ncbi:uncharacterized protein FIBRA_02948 [Fibroporia radiculosa]|uniref:Uncharacterized protein n=1 Tax=Fibroporia radiculosa TaxID=599839 RepID=J4HVQ1_9APHY|nr:uncharacterized protein FIBRA_02948 [Fibroporia radiculosa]CCM00902.1 predicted protein [Fibroporia radiculosa]
MSGPLDRRALEGMKRVDLQKLCKDHGIKANLKSEALVDLLLDTQQPRRRPEPQRTRIPSLRVVSRSTAGSRPRGTSSSSVIIHDSDEEEGHDSEDQEDAHLVPEPQTAFPRQILPSVPLTRKAKQTQYRLGVGRPTLAGGSGARAVTRSLSIPKARVKVSRSVKPKEDAIQEEDEGPPASIAGPSNTAHEQVALSQGAEPDATRVSSSHLMSEFKTQTEEIIQPLKDQIQALQAELQRLTADTAQITTLRNQVGELSAEVDSLRAKMSHMTELDTNIQRLRDSIQASEAAPKSQPSTKSMGKARAVDAGPTVVATIPSQLANALDNVASTPVDASQPPHKATAAMMLGKRHRETDDSHITGTFEDGQQGELSEKELAEKVPRPTRKRAKLGPKDTGRSHSSSRQATPVQELPETEEVDAELLVVPSAPAFTIFSGPEEPPDSYVDPPPPTTHLSDLFGLTPGTAGPTTSTANANENAQQAAPFSFNFTDMAFHPVTSTPAGPFGLGMPTFSYPEPPTSPTPGASTLPSGGYVERAGGRRERNDLFHPHGAPRRPPSATGSRPAPQVSRSQAGPSSATDDGHFIPAKFTQLLAPVTESDAEHSQDATISSNAIGQGLGMSSMPLPPETPAPPMKRTMYGTELEGDTRFGDFGVEGIATGFWTGVVPRF